MRTVISSLLIIGSVSLLIGDPVSNPSLRSMLPDAVSDKDFGSALDHSHEKIDLGRLLFFDKILSGNKNISCATCHHPNFASGDGLALPLGEGATGLGSSREAGVEARNALHGRVPRNSPGLFNTGAPEFTRLFHDGRVEADPHGYYEGGFITPVKWKLPKGLDSVLAAQAMFPVASPEEMAGQKGENPIAEAASLGNAAGPGGVWEIVSKRLQEVPEYVNLFKSAYPDEISEADQITFVHAANAIAAFQAGAFRADNSSFDKFLRGNDSALNESEKSGASLFYGKANCASCHSGKFQTDHDFHAIAMPQIGPGKGHGNDSSYWRASGHSDFVEDFGRGRVTVRPDDNYKFRTPSLRNVELTPPWGHAGVYQTLEDVVRHHLNPVESLHAYRLPEGLLPEMNQVAEVSAQHSSVGQELLNEDRLKGFNLRDAWVQKNDNLRNKIAAANELEPQELSDSEVADIVAFLRALTDSNSRNLSHQIPSEVPSGLPVVD